MLTFERFSGINNVLPTERVIPDAKTGVTPLVTASNVDIGLSGEISRRDGYSELIGSCHKNLWQANGFMLATVDGGDLTSMDGVGANRTTLHPSLGVNRVWYCNLPDDRTTFSNGLINGITNGATATTWGVPIPNSLGALATTSGSLDAGDYQYQLTHVRTSDGLESGPLYSSAATTVSTGGISLSGLEILAGHTTNVYLTAANGDEAFYAGNTAGSTFSFTAANNTLVLPCRTNYLLPAPVGTVTAFYGGRVLIAVDNVLYASLPYQWELFDLRRDFKQFSDDITLIQPVDDGIYIGTTTELAFLSGVEFAKLSYRQVVIGRVVLGSGVDMRGELISGQGSAMICIADGVIVAGFNSGNINRMTEGRYRTDATEVSAAFRMLNDIPQYVAVPQ